MKYIFFAILLFLFSCKAPQLVMEEGMKTNEEIKITVSVIGDSYTDPNENYSITIKKADTLYQSVCVYKGKKIMKSLNEQQMLLLLKFEKEITQKKYKHALCFDDVYINVGNRSNTFIIPCGVDNEFKRTCLN